MPTCGICWRFFATGTGLTVHHSKAHKGLPPAAPPPPNVANPPIQTRPRPTPSQQQQDDLEASGTGAGGEAEAGARSEGGEGRVVVDERGDCPHELSEVLKRSEDDEQDEIPTRLRQRSAELARLRSSSSLYPFESKLALETAIFAFYDAQLSRPKIERLLDLLALTGQRPFRNVDDLVHTIDRIPLGTLSLKEVTLTPYFDPDDQLEALLDEPTPLPPSFFRPVSFRFHDLYDSVQFLLDRPDLEDSILYSPRQVYNAAGKRVISDFMTAEFARKAQNYVGDGVTVLPLIASSDETRLSAMVGQAASYPGYLSIGNYTTRARKDTANKLMIQLFSLPILNIPEADKAHPQWPAFLRQLIHLCLDSVFSCLEEQPAKGTPFLCPDRKVRFCRLFLAAYLADYKEQVRLALILSGRCPLCVATRAEIGLLRSFGARTKASSLALRTSLLSAKQKREQGIHGGFNFSDKISSLDPHSMLAPDLLHQLIKPFRDHIVEWTLALLSDQQRGELDRRLLLMPHYQGQHHFTNGIDFTFQGNDSRQLMQIWIALLVGLGLPSSVITANRAYIELVYLARRSKQSFNPDEVEAGLYLPSTFTTAPPEPSQCSSTAQAYESRLALLRSKRDEAFSSVRDNFILPRHHAPVHLMSGVLAYGAADGLSTDLSERAHIPEVKIPYRRSNRNGPEAQMLLINRRMKRCEALLRRVDPVRRGKPFGQVKKARSSRQAVLVAKWSAGKLDFPQFIPARKRFPLSLSNTAQHFQLSLLLPSLAHFLSSIHTNCGVPYLTQQLTTSDPTLSISPLLTLYSEPLDVTDDPTSSAEFIKSIIRSTLSWSYRQSSFKRGGVRLQQKEDRHPRFDFVLFQDSDAAGFDGLAVGRVRLIFSFYWDGKKHEVVVVEEYKRGSQDPSSGMWRLKGVTKQVNGEAQAVLRVIQQSSLVCGAHVTPDWSKTAPSALRWELFDAPGSSAFLNHFARPELWELVVDTCLAA